MPSYPIASPRAKISVPDFPWLVAVPEAADTRACVAGYWPTLPADWTWRWQCPPECSGCPNLWGGETGHKAVGRTWYEGPGGESAPSGVSQFEARNLIDVYYATASLLSWLYYVVVGPVGFGLIFQGRESINTVEQFTFTVASGSGANLVLMKPVGNDYPWRLDDVEGENVVSAGGGWALYSPVTGLMRRVQSIDYSGLESGSSFGVTLFDGGIGAGVGESVLLLGYVNAPERWAYYQPWVSAWCQETVLELTREELIGRIEESGEWAGWFELTAIGGGSCRIAWPVIRAAPWRSTFRVQKRLKGGGYVDSTLSFFDDLEPDGTRLALTHTSTPASFKTWVRIDPTEDLPSATYDGVRITYWSETGDSVNGTQVSQMHCAYDQRDWTESIGSAAFKGGCGVDGGGAHWFCAKMRESGVLTDNYLPGQCYQTMCPFFELSEPGFPSWEDVGRLWGDSGGIGLLQLFPGISAYYNYRLFRGGRHPSIGYLAGMPLWSSLGLYLPICYWGAGGAFGYWGEDEEWHAWWNNEDGSGLFGHEVPSLSAYGPSAVTGGLNKVPQLGGAAPIDYDGTPSEDWYHDDASDAEGVERGHGGKRLVSFAVGSGAIPDAVLLNPFASGAAGEARYQRVKRVTASFRNLDPESAEVQVCDLGWAQFGEWELDGKTYGLKLQLEALGGNWPALSQVAGVIHSAQVLGAEGSYVLRLTFRPGTVAFGYASETAPQQVLVAYCLAGGNVVEAPPWRRPTNPLASGTRNKFGGMLDKVFPGCTLKLSGVGGVSEQPLTVLRALAHGGAAFSGSGETISTHVVTATVPGFWAADDEGDVSELQMGDETTAGARSPIIDSLTYGYDESGYSGPAGDGEDIESVDFLEVRSETPESAPYAFAEDGDNGRDIVTPTVWKLQEAIDEGSGEYRFTVGITFHFEGESPNAHSGTFEICPEQAGASTVFACCPAIRLAFAPDLTVGNRPTFRRYEMGVGGLEAAAYSMTLEPDPVSGLNYWTDPLTVPSSLTQYKMLYYDGAWFVLFYPHHAGSLFEVSINLASPITVGSTDEPQGPGQPTGYGTYRLKMDVVDVDVSDPTPTNEAIITMATAGSLDGAAVTADYSAVLVPRMRWNGSSFVTSASQGWAAPVIEHGSPRVVIPGGDSPLVESLYLIDRAMGTILFTADFLEAALIYGNPCFVVTAWWFDRRNRLDADVLLGLKRCAEVLTTFPVRNFTGTPRRLNSSAILLCNPPSKRTWWWPDGGAGYPWPVYLHNAHPESWDGVELLPSIVWEDEGTTYDECGGCESDSRYPAMFDEPIICEAAVTWEGAPPPTNLAPFRITDYDADLLDPNFEVLGASGTYDVGVYWASHLSLFYAPVAYLAWDCVQQIVPITAPGCLYRISSSRIAQAWIEVRLSDPVHYRRTYDTINDEFGEEEIEGGVELRVAAYAMTTVGEETTFAPVSGGDAFTSTGGDWQRVDCTTLVRAICDYLPSLDENTELVLTVTPANTEVGSPSDVASLAEQYIEVLEFEVDDWSQGSETGPYGHPGNLKVRLVSLRVTYSAIGFQNLQIKLDLPDAPPWPHTLALPPLEDA